MTTLDLITKALAAMADLSPRLIPLFQVVAVIVGLVVIGMMVWKGRP